MELAALGILALFGSSIYNNIEKDIPIQISKHKTPHNKDIYNSSFLKTNEDEMQTLADNIYIDSKTPEKTGIIPRFYNVMENKTSSEINNNSKENNQMEHFSNREIKDTFLNQYDELTFDNKGEAVTQNELYDGNKPGELLSLEKNLALKNGYSLFNTDKPDMTYGIIKKNHFSHTNMQPFYTGRGMEFNEYNEQNRLNKLDIYSGTSRKGSALGYRPKEEVEAFFKPVPDTKEMKVQTEFMQTRYVPSLRKNDDKPFEPEWVGPQGLDNVRVLDRTIDETRTQNKLRVSYSEPPIESGIKGYQRQVQAPVIKRHPEKFQKYTKEDWLQNGGQQKKSMARGHYVPFETNRMISRTQYGPATNEISQLLPAKRREIVKTSKNTYKNQDVTNKKSDAYLSATSVANYNFPENERSTTQICYNGPISDNTASIYYQYQDDPRTTLKQTMIYNDHDGNMGGVPRSSEPYLQDIIRTTLKQTTDFNNHDGNMSGIPRASEPYLQDIIRTTLKQTTDFNNHDGNMSGTPRASEPYLQDNIRTTLKQTTDFNNHDGNMSGAPRAAEPYLQDNIRTTMKQTMDFNNHDGNMSGIPRASNAHLMDLIRTTLKQTTIDDNRPGVESAPYNTQTAHLMDPVRTTMKQTSIYTKDVIGPNHQQQTGYLSNDMYAPVTHRQTTNMAYSGPANHGDQTGYLTSTYDMPVTMRQTTSDIYYTAPASSQNEFRLPALDEYANMTIDDKRQALALAPFNHPPTQVGAFQGPAGADFNMRLKEMINAARLEGPLLAVNDRTMTTYSQPYVIPETNRSNSQILTQLANNPLVNNVVFQHYSDPNFENFI